MILPESAFTGRDFDKIHPDDRIERMIRKSRFVCRPTAYALILGAWATAAITGFPSSSAARSSPARISPADLTYRGAFRLPEGEPGSEVRTWAYGGHALAFYPGGDPAAPDDGFPGSLFATGHAWAHLVGRSTSRLR